jgi:hypothetical protein
MITPQAWRSFGIVELWTTIAWPTTLVAAGGPIVHAFEAGVFTRVWVSVPVMSAAQVISPPFGPMSSPGPPAPPQCMPWVAVLVQLVPS